MNTNISWGHFRQDGKVDAILDFWRKLTHECLVNSIGVDKDNEDVGSRVNTNLAWGHFRQDGKVDATLDFWRKLAHKCLVNSIGVDKDNKDVGSIPLRTFRIPKKGYTPGRNGSKISRGVDSKQTKWSKVKQKDQKQRCMNYPEYKNRVRTFLYATGECFCDMNDSRNTKLV